MARGRIYIGTAGWHYGHWVGPFYPKGMTGDRFLSYYAQHFHTVEINNTFYQLPTPQTLEGWLDGTPKDFLFTCKASRFITHMKKLREPKRSVKRFFDAIEVLRSKLGPILFQLPPHWHQNAERLEKFLMALPKGYRYAFEFRDESWFDTEIYETLAEHNGAFCVYDLAGRQSPRQVTADFIYIRLHGPAHPYQGRYDRRALTNWAQQGRSWSNAGKDVYYYFDNDEKGYAAMDALRLKNLVERRQV